jgi:hypothetical protein
VKDLAAAESPQPDPATLESSPHLPLHVEVAWADITGMDADFLISGQYMGIRPVGSLLAFDGLISAGGLQMPVLKVLIARGALRCAVGDVHFFPCPDGRRQLLVLGMGRQGLFNRSQLMRAARCAAEAIGGLKPKARISTILVGVGAGNLGVPQAVSGLLEGFLAAMRANHALDIGCLRIVELSLDRAFLIHEAVTEFAKGAAGAVVLPEAILEPENGGGTIPAPFCYSMMLSAVTRAWVENADNKVLRSARALLAALPPGAGEILSAELGKYQILTDPPASDKKYQLSRDSRRDGLKFRIDTDASYEEPPPDRVTFSQNGREVRTAAMTNSATVTERVLAIKYGWIDRIIEDLYDPAGSKEEIEARQRSAYRNLVHPDVREKVAGPGPLVVEVDPRLAGIPWEVLKVENEDPVAVRRPLARQLRTIYSPRIDASDRPDTSRALVIGDPDGTLEWARREALLVAWMLRRNAGYQVDLYVGKPDPNGCGTVRVGKRYADPADLYRVLDRMQDRAYDIVHYSGHGTFSLSAPETNGWAFGDEFLTAPMLENIQRPPTLVFANACLSSQLARVEDSQLVASLADEFMRRGVADYIGTAWAVEDGHAARFAGRFYQQALASGTNMGAALTCARAELHAKGQEGKAPVGLWGAYQHYGDPTRRLPSARPPADAGATTTA